MPQIVRNYLAWFIIGFLLLVFLAIQFVVVPGQRSKVWQGNSGPVQTLKAGDSLGSRSVATRRDLENALERKESAEAGRTAVWSALREGSDWLNFCMSGGKEAVGEVYDPTTEMEDQEVPGKKYYEPITWDIFMARLQELYGQSMDEHKRLVRESREPFLRQELEDRYFAYDNLTTLAGAKDRAAADAEVMAERQTEDLLAGTLVEWQPITAQMAGTRLNPAVNPMDRLAGWGLWREYLIRRDLLERVLPRVKAEVAVTYYAQEPLDPEERETYVALRTSDQLKPEELKRRSVSWERPVTRFVDRFGPVRIESVETGNGALPAPGGAGAEPPSSGILYDRYTLTMGLTAHLAVVEAFVQELMDTTAGMLYVPVGLQVQTVDPGRGGAGRSRPPAAAAVPERPRSRAAAANPAMKLSFRAAALFAGAMTVLLFIVYSYMQLSQLSNAGQKASLELQALKREEGVLSRRVEASVSLSEVEAYAVGELGMVKPSRDQIVYISAASRDHGEVIPQKGFWGSVRQLFSTMSAQVVAFLD